MAKVPFGGKRDIQQSDTSKNYPGNSWIDRDNAFYDPWGWGQNGVDPSSIDVQGSPAGTGGSEVDMGEASTNNPGPGAGGRVTNRAPVPNPKPWRQGA